MANFSLWGMKKPRSARTGPESPREPIPSRGERRVFGERLGGPLLSDTQVIEAHRLESEGKSVEEIAGLLHAPASAVRIWLNGHRRCVGGKRVHQPRFPSPTIAQVAEVHRLNAGGRTQVQIGDALGLSQTTVSRILRGLCEGVR